MIQRLILTAVQSGTITTLLALLMLGVYLAKPSTNDSAYFSFCLGRAYTLTMLFNLNLRRSLDDKCHTCGVNAEGISLSSVICTSGKHLPAELMYPKDREVGYLLGLLGVTLTLTIVCGVEELPSGQRVKRHLAKYTISALSFTPLSAFSRTFCTLSVLVQVAML